MATEQKRVRLGFIGLSTSSQWGQHAHLPYLLSPMNKSYSIAAICNSTVDSASKAVSAFSLPKFHDRNGRAQDVRAYGSPDDLAADPDVDVVVCVTDVRKHRALAEPALKAGKRCFVEWPLGRGLADARHLHGLAGPSASDMLVGLEDLYSPLVQAARSIVIDDARIGRINAVNFRSSFYSFGKRVPQKVAYALQRESFANLVTVHLSHYLAGIIGITGLRPANAHARLATAEPDALVVDANDAVVEHATKTSPDRVAVVAELQAAEKQAPALLNVNMSTAPAFPGRPGIELVLEGSKGQVRITGSGPFASEDPTAKLEVTVYNERLEMEVETIDWKACAAKKEGASFDDLPTVARNVARLYEGYAKGEVKGSWADWNGALALHEVVDAVFETADSLGEHTAEAHVPS